jgi:hypothetical protein
VGKSQQKIILASFLVALLLLLANVLVKKFVGESDGNIQLLQKDIEFRLLNSLQSFGIKDEWIKKKEVQSPESKAKYPFLYLSVPYDLTIPEILLDITNEFRNDSLKIECEEKVSGGKTLLSIYENNRIIIRSEFTYSKKISRNGRTAAFLIDDVLPDNPEDSALIESPELFTALLNPSEENLKILKFLKEESKDYSVLIGDDIKDPVYKLKASYSRQRILNVVKALSSDYSGASFFVVDDNSEFYKSTQYDFFEKEMEKRKIKFYKISDFTDLRENEDLIAGFNKELDYPDESRTIIYLMSKDEFIFLKPEILLNKKKGMKIINISRLH